MVEVSSVGFTHLGNWTFLLIKIGAVPAYALDALGTVPIFILL